MKLIQAGIILIIIGSSLADSAQFLVPTILIMLGMASAIVGGINERIF